jgi:hypothetical protein
MTMSLGLHLGLGHHRGSSIGGSPVNTVAPSISGTRGGTLTATPGTWTGATSVSGEWYADGVATGNTTTSFTDSDTSKSLEYRETALPGSVVAKAFRGALTSGPLYSEDFSSYADGTRLAERYNTTSTTTFAATATPHVAGWDGIAAMTGGDTEVTGGAQALRIFGGKVQQTYNTSGAAGGLVVRDLGATDIIADFTLSTPGGNSAMKRRFVLSGAAATTSSRTGIMVDVNNNGFANGASFSFSTVPASASASLTSLPSFADGEGIRIKLDATNKRIYFFRNGGGTVLGNAAGYDLSTWAGPWTSKVGFQDAVDSSNPPAGQNICDAITVYNLQTNTITSAAINYQASGAPGKKQIDIIATVPVAGATGAQYKVETEAGEFVQGWTAMTFASGTATASYPIPDFAYEGQKFNVLVRNVGGTVITTNLLTPTNGYDLQQSMRVAMNDSDLVYYGGQVPGRDIFQPLTIPNGQAFYLVPITGTDYHVSGTLQLGEGVDSYNHWDEDYGPAQPYPDAPVEGTGNAISSITFSGTTATVTTATAHGRTTGEPVSVSGAAPSAYNVTNAAITVTSSTTFTYTMASTPATNATTPGSYWTIKRQQVFYNGVQWARTSNTPRSGVAPDPTDSAGTTSGWKRIGYARGSVVGMKADGWPSKLPDDTNLTIGFPLPSSFPANRAYPITVNCKTEPGKRFVTNGTGVSIGSVDPVAGTFTLTFTADGTRSIRIDRSLTSAISDAFFISGIPSYETGSPAADIGAPYVGVDKLSDLAPFYGYRPMKGAPIERFAGGRLFNFTAANVQPDGSTPMWKYHVDLANQLTLPVLKLAMPDKADDAWITACAAFVKANLNGTTIVNVTLSNEDWNFGYQNAQDLLTDATAAGITRQQLYARRLNHIAALWKAVWGAEYDSRVKLVLEWQSVAPTSDYQAMLDFENCWQNVKVVSCAPYFGGGIGSQGIIGYYDTASTALKAAVAANSQTDFDAACDAMVRIAIDDAVSAMSTLYKWLPGYAMGKGLGKNAYEMESYEAGQHLMCPPSEQTKWDAGLGAGSGAKVVSMLANYKRALTTTKFKDSMAYYLDQMAAKAPHTMFFFTYTGTITYQGWGSMDETGATTQEPYATVKAKALAYNV